MVRHRDEHRAGFGTKLMAACLSVAACAGPRGTDAVEAFFISCMAARGHEVWAVEVPPDIEDCCGFTADEDTPEFHESVHHCEQQIYQRFG